MAMVVVRYINGQQRVVQAQSWRQLDSESAPFGAILLRKNDDGGRLYAVKSSIYEVEEVPQETWDKMMKAESDRKMAEAQKQTDEWRRRKPLNRLRRLFGKKAK